MVSKTSSKIANRSLTKSKRYCPELVLTSQITLLLIHKRNHEYLCSVAKILFMVIRLLSLSKVFFYYRTTVTNCDRVARLIRRQSVVILLRCFDGLDRDFYFNGSLNMKAVWTISCKNKNGLWLAKQRQSTSDKQKFCGFEYRV